MGNPANEKSEKDALASAPPIEEMPDDVPEENDLNSSTVNFRPGVGFSVTCNLKPFNLNMSFEEIKTILIQYTSNTWFKSSAKAKNIEILNIEYSFASVYHLQCYNQSRQIKEKYCRYRAGRLDDESLGNRIPGMWDIAPSHIPKDFQKSKEKAYMPHSESVRKCGGCGGKGYNWETTSYTDSKGETQTRTEKVTCSRCGGNGVLKYWLQCNIEWLPTLYGCVASDSKISKKHLRKAHGFYIFENKDTKVLPVDYLGSALCAEISAFSAQAISKHEKSLKINQVAIRQRQTIKVVPIAECHYRYKDRKLQTFYVYGRDRKEVYAPSFPSDFGCSLM